MQNLVRTESGVELIAPTVHINGSGRDSLGEGYSNALEAVLEARRVLQDANPHGRDYYPQNEPGEHLYGSATTRAVSEQSARLAKLIQIEEELIAILISIYGS